MRPFTIIALLVLTCSGTVRAQLPVTATTNDRFLSRIVGDWRGEGTFSKASSQGWGKWEAVLEENFVRFSVKFEIKTDAGSTRTFAGHAYYSTITHGEILGHWFDSEGHQYPIKSFVSGDTMTTFWGIPGSVEGRSTYRLTDADKGLELVDSFKRKDGTWQELNRFTFRRN